ncbi:citrate lyase subunit beta / citryl-CoA lyase [Rhodococcus triatomae]|uniref:Citrate lyase subunit beta / citryl-CoA lyase n=1 Tax=Rhodococcus triatomae TaxID=300028 RepID=A0A1G8GFC1_9NOCA|nr:citrate lyase subunit beta / citryl-CoA lyase [Rhodococcus triatomae]
MTFPAATTPAAARQHPPVRRRAVLVAPASDERKARKALESGADEVVLDLEDAVTAAHKESARAAATALVAEYGAHRTVSVRVNGLDTDWARDDLQTCGDLGAALASAVLPKTESTEQLSEAATLLGRSVPLQALVETPRAIEDIGRICAAERVEAVIIGYADLGAALGRSATAQPQHWLAVQDRVLHAARAAGIQAIDGPFLGIRDDDSFRTAKRWVSELGFDGTWAIHPAQIDTATAFFTPSEEAVDDARRVLAALDDARSRGAGAARLDGRMLDEAVAVAARRTLAKAGAR